MSDADPALQAISDTVNAAVAAVLHDLPWGHGLDAATSAQCQPAEICLRAPGGYIGADELIRGFIGAHEGALSLQRLDNGNWYDPARFRAHQTQHAGLGELVGSKFGVTAYALINYRLHLGWNLAAALEVTRDTMSAMDLDTAVAIGLALYYEQPGISRLPWNRVTMSELDKAWGSGPGTAIKLTQRMIGTTVDLQVGPGTISADTAWLAQHGEEEAAHLWCNVRIAFDEGLNQPTFINGWNNRSRSFLPGTAWWTHAGGTT